MAQMALTEHELDLSHGVYGSGLELVGQAALDAASIHARLTAVDPASFSAAVWTNRLGGVRLTRYDGSALIAERSGDRLRDHYSRLVQVGITLRGVAEVEQGGQRFEVPAGSAAVVRQDIASRIEGTAGYVAVQSHLDPRRVRAWGFGDADLEPGAWVLSPAGRAAAATIEAVAMCGPPRSPALTRHLAQTVAHATLAVLAERGPGVSIGEPSAVELLRQRILSAIDARFAQPGLDADALAASLGVSRRYVYRSLEGTGVSVAALIRERRLDHAGDLILTPGRPPSVAEVARQCGFASPGAFSRAFAARFGCAPGQFRLRVDATDG